MAKKNEYKGNLNLSLVRIIAKGQIDYMVGHSKTDYLNIFSEVLSEDAYLKISQADWNRTGPICFTHDVRTDIYRKLGSMQWEKIRIHCMLKMWSKND